MTKEEALAHARELIRQMNERLAEFADADGNVEDWHGYDRALGMFEQDALEALEWLVAALDAEEGV